MVSLADIHINRSYEAGGSADEDLSYLSMESLFTPAGSGHEERRMQVRAYNHWLARAENGELPAVEDLRPEGMAELGPNGVLVDLTLGAVRPAIVYLGDLLAKECGGDQEILALGDVPDRSLLSRLTEHCLEVVATRAPVGHDAEFEDRFGRIILYRSILLPYSSDGHAVDFVFGVISWKERPEPPASLVAPTIPETACAEPDLLTPSLSQLLFEARKAAGHASASEKRSRETLYHAISATYDLVLALVEDPASLELAIADSAECDAVRAAVKLVFGPHYDKTRRSELVSLLTGAQRSGLPRGSLFLRLTAQGGIKAMLAQIRFQRSGAASRSTGRQVSHPLADRLKQLKPRAVEAALAQQREFGLIVARRSPCGALDLIGDAGDDVRLLERAAKRLLTD